MTYSPEETGHPEIDATRARQGRWGRHLLWVLLASVVLAAVAMLVAWAWRGNTSSDPSQAEQRQAAESFDAPVPPAPTPPPSR